MKIKIWALSYASIDSDDELYTATIGLYDSKDDAFKAMKDNVSYDIKDGDIEDNWKKEKFDIRNFWWPWTVKQGKRKSILY